MTQLFNDLWLWIDYNSMELIFILFGDQIGL